ncbi:MAG: PQQ-binding-like beta-propeller repeat protein [Prolixibacteraceae bacterium]|nr:PQQ-binding-like beta-propeller repeat protein [Prolixibacteraceae bacterium]
MNKFKLCLIISFFLFLSAAVTTAQNNTNENEYLYSEAIEVYQQEIEKEVVSHSLAENYCAQFRGNNCSGVAPAGAHPPVSLVPEESLVWKTEIASGVSSPCVWENSVFLTGYEPYDRLLVTYCINKESGAILWEKSVWPDSIEPVHAVGSPAAATPVADGKHVYVYFGSYGVVCYDFEGNLVWGKKLPIPESDYGSCGSPVVANNILLVNRLNELLALDKETGETIYTANITGSQATPVIRGNEILLHQYLGLKSINIDDGSENWNLSIVTLGNSTPVLSNNMLFVNGFTNIGETRLYDKLPEFNVILSLADHNADGLIQISEIPDSLALFRRPELDLPFPDDTMYSWQKVAPNFDFTKDDAMNETEWKQMKGYWEKYMLEHGVVAIKLPENETQKPELIWKESNYIAEIPSLLCNGNQVYMISNGGLVTCMNTGTGEVIYREKLGAPGAYLASPLLANGHIYFVSYNGKITVVKPDENLNVISQCNLKEKIAASPVAADNQLLVRSTEALYAFGK